MKKLSNIIVNFYAIAFIVAAVAALLLHSKAYGGMIMFIGIGVSLWLRKVFGVYAVMFISFVVAGVGLIFFGLGINDIFHRVYKFDGIWMGLIPITLSFMTIYFFTHQETANIFGLPKITIWRRLIKKTLFSQGNFC